MRHVTISLYTVTLYYNHVFVYGMLFAQVGIQTRTVADLTAVADFVRTNNVPILFVALLGLQFLSMLFDRLVSYRVLKN